MVKRSILPLRIQGATVRKRDKVILNEVTAEFDENGFTIVMGPNGSGKTTFLRLMHGLERPRSGTVNWSLDETEARTKQAFVFQTPVMMRRSVVDNIAYSLRVRGTGKKEARNRAALWSEHVGLASNGDLEAHFLSGGERQKLAIARALIGEPDVLFLDEPTTNLDGRSTKEIEAILMTASSGGTRIIMTTHDIGQARRLATDIVFLNKGTICEQGPAVPFFKHAKSPPARAYLKGDIVE